MYITHVLFKRVFNFIGDLFLLVGSGLVANYYFRDKSSSACKAPSSVWHEHVPACNDLFHPYTDICNQVVGLNLHSSFAPVGKEEHNIMMRIAFMGYIL